MKQKFYCFVLTALFGLFGMNVWAQELSTTVIDGKDYYEITCAEDLAALSQIVNAGEFEANAVLTNDIDLADMIEMDGWTAIGDWGGVSGTASACYKGHFNGQGHTITGFNATSTHNYYGIFGVVSTGCLIENFTIYGKLNLGHKTGGVVGYSRDATPTIRNIHSYLNLNCTEEVANAQRPGGILGSAVNGTTVVENCTYSGTLNAGGHTGNIGGIVGYVNNNTAAIVNITNCLFDGKILNGTTAEGQCGGIIGYNNAGVATIKNCLSIGEIISSDGNIGQLIGRLNGSNTKFYNNYYVGDFVNGTASGKSAGGETPVQVTAAQLASGEICFALNGNQSENPSWFQAVGKESDETITYPNVQYTGTVNGEENDPRTHSTDITIVNNGDGTINIVIKDFAVRIQGTDVDVDEISLDNVLTSEGEDGLTHFDVENGTFTIPNDKLPSKYQALVAAGLASFTDMPFSLHGKKNAVKIYGTLSITVIASPTIGGNKEISIEVATDDFYPIPYGTEVVYPAGRQHCDGTAYTGVTGYSNTPSAQDDHDFADGFCSYCGALDVNYMTPNADGNFEIGTANQLKWFAFYVNQVDPAVNAILTADIDLDGVEWTPIGKGVYYGGVFDGQDFTISNLNYVGSGDCNGLFGGIKDATVKNFSISGTIVCAGSWSGVIGRAENATISNIHSALTIETPATGAFHHAGGVVGGSYNPTTIDRCTFSGTMTVNAESHDCFGGIVGYTTDYCTISNCANYGTIYFAKNNCYAGGIVGYINSTACYGAHNCLNVGDVIYTGEGDPSYSGAIVGRLRGNNPDLWGDNYYKEGSAVNANGENQIPTNYEATDAQLASGEIAFKLGSAWGQEIGVDPYPVLGGKKVFAFGDTYANIEVESSYGSDACILPAKKYGGEYSAYTYVAQGNFDYGDWNTSNPNYNLIIGTPEEQDGKAWYTPGYNVTSWNYGQDLPDFGDGRPADVYAVRFFSVEGEIPSTLYMPAPHDDAPCEYYINGEQIWAETDGWYEDEVVRMTDEQKALIKTDGTVNVFAFHVHQNWGGRYADGGLYTAGAPVDAFNNDANKAALEATIALAENESIDANVIEFAQAKSNYRGGFTIGLAQLRKARRLAADARTENFTGTAPADGMIAYIFNVGAKMFLAGGNDWGTHASLNHMGAKCVLHASGDNYAIQTNLPNGTRGNNDWLGRGGYVDVGSPEAWEIEPLADGTYHIINTANSGANIYLGMTDDERLQVDTDKAGADNEFNKWIFVTPEEFETLAEAATENNPVDLGHLVHQATFSQNDFDGNDKWASNCNAELGDSKWERNAGGIWGWKENWTGDLMFEMWNTAAVGKVYLKQVVEGLPVGKYTIQMNGYYRDGNFESADEGNVRKLAYLYAGSEDNCVPLVSIVEGSGNYPGYGRGGASGIVIPDGCADAARFFQVGTYVNTIDAFVGIDGKLEIGVYRDAEDVKGGDWITTDNWRLYYKGKAVEVKISDAGYATFVAPWNFNEIPTEVEAFAAQANKYSEGYVHLEPVSAIPAGEAVVLKGAEGSYIMYPTSESVELGTENDLIAATADVTADGTQYILAKLEGIVGFAEATPSTTIAAGKGYLVITGGDVKPFYPFADDNATGIKGLNDLKNLNGDIYNVAGQRLQKMQKGINIVNGKKVLY